MLTSFPVDDESLGMIERALNLDGLTDQTSVLDLCQFYSELAGADPQAVESEEDGIAILRDAQYHPYDIIAALIAEVRRLRQGERLS